MRLTAHRTDSYPVAEFWFIWSDKLGLPEYPPVYITLELTQDMFVIELLFLLALPLVLACGASYLAWRALSRPAVFLIVATVVLYFLYAVLMWLLNPGPVGYTLSVQQPGEPPTSQPWLLLLPPYKIPLGAFAVAAVPVLAVLLRAFKKGRASEV